jgi:predicted ABC-type transport system involved in lysophospholipase L1 biosynthesis ATPase subunit
VIELFVSHARNHGLSVLIATHNPALSAWCSRELAMRDGRLLPRPGSPT